MTRRRMMNWLLALAILLPAGRSLAQAGGSDFRQEVKGKLKRALQQLKEQEPDIRDTQRAALEFFRIDFETVGSMRSRAGWKSIMPTVSGKYRQNQSLIDLDKWDYMNFPGAQAGWDYVTFDVKEFEVAGTWDLSRLVFNPEVLDVASLVVLQEAVLKEVTRIYYTRRRLQVDLIIAPPADVATLLSKELRVEELTATLDAMTGGFFSRTIEAKSNNGRQGD